jgi:hypothetical protein
MKTPILFSFLLVLAVPLSAQSLPDWMSGEWDGLGNQSNTQTQWVTWMTFFKNHKTPQVEYPDLECEGYWEFQYREGDYWVFRERVTENSGQCAENDWVYVRYKSEDELEVQYAHSWGKDQIIARLTLRKRPRA